MISIIDVEASGFGFDSYPIEVGVVTANNERLCFLIHPFEDWIHWDEDAASVHGIDRDMLHEKGIHAVQVCSELNALLKSTTIYSDAWVHDSDWINKLFNRSGISMAFRISPIESIMSERHLEYWDNVKVSVIKELGLVRHRASSDALIIQQTFDKTNALVNDLCG